jgi:hypothetical protein
MKKVALLLIVIVLLTGCSAANLEAEVSLLESDIDFLEIDIEIEKTTNADLKQKNTELEAKVSNLKNKINELESLLVVEPEEAPEMTSASLLTTAIDVIELIELQDFMTVSTYVDSTIGLRFSPYSYIDFGSDLWFTPTQVANLMSDPLVYTWGTYDGSGDPITTNFIGYYNEFVYDETYASPHLIGNNILIGTGNMINNINTVYPTASFVEFHFIGFDPTYDGMDWTSIRLIFEYVSGNWKLIGVEHDNWTI